MTNQQLLKDLTSLGLDKDPIVNFQNWFNLARNHPGIPEAMRMMVATAGPDSEDNTTGDRRQPSLRWLQMGEFIEDGSIVFNTSSNSRKGFEVSCNERVAINFSWFPISKLVYIEGTASKLSRKESEHYFKNLPQQIQLLTVALKDKQSQPLDSVNQINERVEHLNQSSSGSDRFDMPDAFSSYKVKIHRFEFIELQNDKFDDRIAFTKKGFSNRWLNENAKQEAEGLRVGVNLGDHGEWFIERFGV